MKFKPTSISLHPDDAGRLHHRLQALGMTRSEYVRQLIRQDIQAPSPATGPPHAAPHPPLPPHRPMRLLFTTLLILIAAVILAQNFPDDPHGPSATRPTS